VKNAEPLELRWPIVGPDAAGVEYPLTRAPYAETRQQKDEIYYEIIMHWHPWFEAIGGECVDTNLDITCDCGAAWAIASDASLRFRATCGGCRKPFDPTRHVATIEDSYTGKRGKLVGPFYRFAIEIDCGKCLPEDGGAVMAKQALVRLCEDRLDTTLLQVGTIY